MLSYGDAALLVPLGPILASVWHLIGTYSHYQE
jgi:hypothetical protein